jgi:hypothetical protein
MSGSIWYLELAAYGPAAMHRRTNHAKRLTIAKPRLLHPSGFLPPDEPGADCLERQPLGADWYRPLFSFFSYPSLSRDFICFIKSCGLIGIYQHIFAQAGLLNPGSSYRLRLPSLTASDIMQLSSPITAAGPALPDFHRVAYQALLRAPEQFFAS